MTINELRRKRAEHWEMMKNFLNSHEDENGNLNADDAATYANYDKVMDDFDKAVERAEKAEEREQALNKNANSPLLNGVGSANKNKAGRASDEYKAEFLNYIRTRHATNALQEGTASEGGYLVPTEFERTLFEARDKVDPIFTLAGRMTLGALEKNVPYVSSNSSAVLIAEEGSYTESDASFGQITFHAYKFGLMSKASDELIADSVFDIMSFIAKDFGKALAKCQAGYFWTGTGSSQPQGVMTAAGSGVTTASASAITADELIDLYYSVPEEYRANAAFAMKDTTVKYIRKLKIGTGEYLWNPGLNGQPSTLLGKPLHTSENIEGIGAGKKTIAFGDFAECFKIADRQGVGFKVLDQLYAATGQIGFRGDQRSDSRGIFASTGIKTLTMHA